LKYATLELQKQIHTTATQQHRLFGSLGLHGHHVQSNLDIVVPPFFGHQTQESPTMQPVGAKTQGLGKKYIALVVPILFQNLIDLGYLLGFSDMTGLALLRVLDDIVEVFKAVIKGGRLATLLFNWAAN